MRSLAVVAGLVLAGVASVLPARATATEVMPFLDGNELGGGVVDLRTGRRVDRVEKADGFASVSGSVLPYARGGRYRIPMLLQVDSGVGEVLVLGVRLATAELSVARGIGAVWNPDGCCALRDAVPVTPFRMGRGAIRDGVPRGVAVVGVDVELCCTVPERGWTELLPGVAVTYRHLGATRTAYLPFPGIQQVVIRA